MPTVVKTNWVMPEDRPRKIVYNKKLDTAADCDVALRCLCVCTYSGIPIACIAEERGVDADGTNTRTLYPLSADELFDCCVHGCAFIDRYDNGEECVKPFQWGPATSMTTRPTYAALMKVEESATETSPSYYIVYSAEAMNSSSATVE